MKDITKGEILGAIDSTAVALTRDRQKIAAVVHHALKDAYLGTRSGATWETGDGKLRLELTIKRTDRYIHELRKKERS